MRSLISTFPLLWILSAAVAAAVLLPVGYLVLQWMEAGPRLWALILRPQTLVTLARTLGLALSVVVASAALAIPLAWLTLRTDLPFRKAFTVLAALPMVIPSYVGAYLFAASLGPRGILAGWLSGLLGLERLPSIYGFPGALWVLTLLNYPFLFLTVRAAWQGLDPALEEAGRSLGTGPFHVFWRVTLPQLRPALASGSLLVALYVLRDFGAVSIMRYDTFTRLIYLQYQSAFDRSLAGGLALVLVLLTLALLALEVRTRGRARFDRTATGSARQAPRVSLGAWRLPALVFCAGVVVASLLIPMGVLLYWLGRGLRAGAGLEGQWLPLLVSAWNSFLASGMAAAVTLAAALPGVILSVRGKIPGSALLERLAFAGYAMPGIAVALALVFLGVKAAPLLYGTLPMLVLAYVILFLPQASGAVRASLLQVHPSLEDAARSLGKKPWEALRSVTLPLVRPGLRSGAALVFLTAMKELPATLILSPLGFTTLATRVWSAVSEAYFAQAAAPALLLVLVASLPMAFFVTSSPPSPEAK